MHNGALCNIITITRWINRVEMPYNCRLQTNKLKLAGYDISCRPEHPPLWCFLWLVLVDRNIPDSKVHGANKGSTWRQMNLAIWDDSAGY